MNAPRPRTAAALLALAASACAAAGDAGDAPGDANRAPDDAAAQTWSLVEELRIGSADDPEASLTAVPHRGLAIGPQGHIYVAQPQDGQIRVYDRDGPFLYAFGGKGGGPGEFTRLFAIGILADTVYAVNFQPGRVSFFTLDGEHVETTLLSAVPGDNYAPMPPYLLFPDGTSVASRGFAPDLVTSGRIVTVPDLRIDRARTVLDTLFEWSPARTHIRITVTTLAHDTMYSRGHPYTPVALPGEVIKRTIARRAARLERMFASRVEAESKLREALNAPAFYPPITCALFADDGNLWLRREARDGAEDQLWEVHDANGDPVAAVRLPVRIVVHLVHQDVVWGVEHDELDVPYVVAYRIERGAR